MNAIGKKRLLKLAEILDTADAKHREKGEPRYNQAEYAHPCGTPACALGHWARAQSRRWFNSGCPTLKDRPQRWGFTAAMIDFGLETFAEAEDLFGADGCGGARTAKQAAKYIRRFVKRKEQEK